MKARIITAEYLEGQTVERDDFTIDVSRSGALIDVLKYTAEKMAGIIQSVARGEKKTGCYNIVILGIPTDGNDSGK